MLFPRPVVYTLRETDSPEDIQWKIEATKGPRDDCYLMVERSMASKLESSRFPAGARWRVRGYPSGNKAIASDIPDGGQEPWGIESEDMRFHHQGSYPLVAATVQLVLGDLGWWRSIDVGDYANLVARSILRRQRTHGDVMLGSKDDWGCSSPAVAERAKESHSILSLWYYIGTEETNLLRAAEAIESIRRHVMEPVENVATDVARVVQTAISRLSAWGAEPIDQLADAVDQQEGTNEKGEALEELAARLFSAVPGFQVERRVRTTTEEIDIHILNRATDPLWSREQALLIAECKNWMAKCGKDEFVLFRQKIANRGGRCSCGFLVSWNGFTETVTREMLRGTREDLLVIPIAGQDLRRAALNNNMSAVLEELWHKAVLL